MDNRQTTTKVTKGDKDIDDTDDVKGDNVENIDDDDDDNDNDIDIYDGDKGGDKGGEDYSDKDAPPYWTTRGQSNARKQSGRQLIR
jgi:hypothetical protein